MSNYNLERGQELYFDQLSQYCKRYLEISEEIMNLGSLFANNVGVMREGIEKKDFVFDEETNLLSYSWTPSYKYLARRVADTVYINFTSETKLSTREMIERVFTNEKFTIDYEFSIGSNEDTKSKSRNENVIAEETNNISKQAEQFHNFTYETMAVEKDGVVINVEVPVDEIDLIYDFEDDDLSDEGKRSVGIIDLDYDTTQGHNPKILQRDKMLIGKLEMVKKVRYSEDNEISYDDYQITCPYTGSTDVYQISSNVYASYETDQPFKVDFNLPDLTPVD